MAPKRLQPRLFQPRLLVGSGPRATEEFLRAEIDRRLAEAEGDPALLARPVRVVVPSRSLRLHLGSAIARHRRRSAAALLVQTHFHLALEVIERAGEPLRSGRWLADVIPERKAREQSSLAHALDDLVDGYAAVVGTVRDLLDAGLEPALVEGLDEALVADGPQVATRRQVARARALVGVARETFETIERSQVGSTSRLMARAAELLEARGEALLPTRAMYLYGYADATGVVTDLLQALQRRFGAWVLLDRPPDPADPADPERTSSGRRAVPGPQGRFGELFVERLRQTADPEPVPERPADAESKGRTQAEERSIELFTAHGADGEVREVARRIAALLGDGSGTVRPEGIAVVARDLGPYRRAIRRRFGELGLPFSALGAGGPLTPEERRSRALLDLLRRGPRTPSERWIEALERLPSSAERQPGTLSSFGAPALMDLRLGLAALGAGRLQDVARLDVDAALGDRSALRLPVRQGIRAADRAASSRDQGPEDEEEATEEVTGSTTRAEVRVLRRTLGRPVLEAAVAAARQLLEGLQTWPRTASLGDHRRRLQRLVHHELGWRDGDGGARREEREGEESAPRRPLLEAVENLEGEAPAGFAVSFDELRLLLTRVLDQAPGSPLGGDGGGVQVLTVTEARARTFDHLFLLGLNRGVFPRPIRPDPLLPDELRRVLQRVLPDVPIKETGFDEERYLFAQLLSASPRVVLSWQRIDDAGAVRPPSPLVARLGLGEPVEAEPVWSLPSSSAPSTTGARPAAESATRVALHGPRSLFRRVFARVVDPRLAAARLAVLDELDPDQRTPEGRAAAARLGPFFGFVGPAGEADPRQRELWVTTLERLAGCPWQVFLTRLLGLEPTPDPLAALPGLDPLLLGRCVHRTLEEVVAAAGPTPPSPALAEIRQASPERSASRPAWPEESELEGVLATTAREVLLDEGLALPGLARALARAARPYLDTARQVDWAAGAPEVLGVEVRGELTLADGAGRPRRLHFRADRVDRGDAGLLLTDYKTGRPPRRAGNEGKKPETRRRYLLEDVQAGTRLQAVAYALAGSEGEASAAGRYLFLRPDVDYPERAVTVDEDDFVAAFREAGRAGLAVWDAGALFPRVVDPAGEQEPARCSWCPVAEACVRGDSGARLRLAEWAQRAATGAEGTADASPADPAAALLAVWWLPGERPSPRTDSSENSAERGAGDGEIGRREAKR